VGFALAYPSLATEYQCLSDLWQSMNGGTFARNQPAEYRRAIELQRILEDYGYAYQQALDAELGSLYLTGFRP
jgi:hypothetical protein